MLKLLGRFKDPDGTEKFVYKNPIGIIEITWIKNKNNRNMDVFCLPTHYYCDLGCKFCHLTNKQKQKMPPILPLELAEAFRYTIKTLKLKYKVLFSFMGVGEPFLNPTLIIDFYKDMKKLLLNHSISVALSTMVPNINVFSYFINKVNKHNIPLKIHFSLHSPIDKIRNEIIPASKTPVEKILKALENYEQKTINNIDMMLDYLSHHSYQSNIEIHYTIINNTNDSFDELMELIRLGREYNIRLKILKFNPTKNFKTSGIYKFWVHNLKISYEANVVEYSPPGTKIGSSCGQFTKHYYLKCGILEYVKFLIWKIKYKVKEK